MSRTIRPSGIIPAVDTGSHESSDRFCEPPVSMVCWSHEMRTSVDDVIADMSLIPNARDGDVAELRTLEGKKTRKLYFLVKQLSEDVAKMVPNLQISVLTGNLLTLLDIPPRSKVEVKLTNKQEVEADLVEIHFKDTYLTRADMWRIASTFIGRCFYTSQRITYCDTVRCSINEIYRNGRKVFSAFISPSTKFVYRSESARTIYFIQMSSEMWHFEETGEVMFHKLINSFLPEVFKRWREQGAHHVVTIVLFTSVDVSDRKAELGHGERERDTRDYFRVVVDQVHINQWSDIMATLRYEFSQFAKEVLLQSDGKIQGRLLPAVKGNLMEAVSLAMTMVTSKFQDRDLRQTNSQVIIVTPGSGIFDVDYDLFFQNSMKLLSIEISIDLVCLSRTPLHVTPLFRFKRNNRVVNCIPSWLDISFWKSTDRYAKQWIPRCKIYEIQMMGVMENEVCAISIDYLPKQNNGRSLERLMDDYDRQVHAPKNPPHEEGQGDNHVEPPYLLKPRVSSSELYYNNCKTDSNSIPASAIISSPHTTEGSSTAELLNNTIKPRPKMSALTSLLSLGMRRDSSAGGNGVGGVNGGSEPPSPRITSVSSFDNATRQLAHQQSMSSLSSRSSSPPAATTMPRVRPSINRSPSTTPHHHHQQHHGSPAEHDETDRNYVWVMVNNPSNTLPENIQDISNYGRWKNVFPKGVKRRAVKWRSLKSPASLPLATEIFPSVEEFERNYTFHNYVVMLSPEKEEHMTAGNLLEEMVAMRLLMGFQIVVGDRVSRVEAHRRQDGTPSLIVQAVPKDFYGIRIYMTRSNQIHRLACDHFGQITVQVYRKTAPEMNNFTRAYHPMVQTKYETGYSPAVGNFFDPSVRNVNWNLLDQQLAGFDDAVEGGNGKMFRIRFVLIPTELPPNHPLIGEVDLDTEEIRLEGLRKIILQLHKTSYLSDEERRRNKAQRKSNKEANPPEIKFYTGELGDFLVSLLENYKNYYEEPGSKRKKKLFVNETMNRNTVTLQQVAAEMQGERGCRLQSRRWHWRLYTNCFVGQEFVAWMLDSFTDVDTSEDAVEFGNELMAKGLFAHVDNRHAFLDGHYFYQLNSDYLKPQDKDKHVSWFGKKVAGNGESSPSVRSSGGSANEVYTHKRKGSGISDTSSRLAVDEPAAPVLPKILISRALKVDIDPGKRATRHEFLTVHVDRVHNPENAFHMRMEWVNATPKLIDEAVINLGRIGERYGWKFVQVPIDEISSLPNGNPFCSFIKTAFTTKVDLGPVVSEDPLYYHRYVLTKLGFVLDTVSASSLMKKREVDILYSWGRPFYNYDQYVHKSGIVLAQIADNNSFILMANTLHISRSAVGSEATTLDTKGVPDAEKIMYEFQRVCQTPETLQGYVDEATKMWNELHLI